MTSKQADFRHLSSKFRVQKDSKSSFGTVQSTKKARESLVCNQCRESKLGCDKNHPCQTCCKKDQAEFCSYVKPARIKAIRKGASVAEERLEHLEELVKQLIQNQSSPKRALPPTPPWVIGDLLKNPGGQDLVNPAYVGATHWSSVLDDIHEIKAAIAGYNPGTDKHYHLEMGSAPATTEADVIFGSATGYSLSNILSYHLPEKLDTDRYVATFFKGETYIVPYIHAYQFQNEYQQFWRDPENVNPIWLSILFSVCHIASTIGGSSLSNRATSGHLMQGDPLLHIAAGQCLVVGNYQRPQKFVIEALGMYGVCKNLQTLDPCREAGTILSMCVRMCYEMGYHRDPNHLGQLTPFEGEMRRRCWSAVKQMDLMVSFQLGLPSSVCLENCDTASPHNLLDSDFDVNSTCLPPARPESEGTSLLWFVVKDRQIIGFSKVWSEALSFAEKSDMDIMLLDEELQRSHKSVPEVLKVRPLSESIIDPPFLIVTRLYIEFIYLKSLCVLHRKYMTKGRLSSTKRCIVAALLLVGNFIDMHKEFAPGGQLQGERWMLTNFTINDFLLGIMILCQFVHLCRMKTTPEILDALPTEVEALKLLDQALLICIEKSTLSRDSQRVARVIELIINGVDKQVGEHVPRHHTPANLISPQTGSEPTLEKQQVLHSESNQFDFDLAEAQNETSGWMNAFTFFEDELASFN